jgi:hypothetical protein
MCFGILWWIYLPSQNFLCGGAIDACGNESVLRTIF